MSDAGTSGLSQLHVDDIAADGARFVGAYSSRRPCCQVARSPGRQVAKSGGAMKRSNFGGSRCST